MPELIRVIALLAGLLPCPQHLRGRPSPEHSSAPPRVTWVVLPTFPVLRRPPTSHRSPVATSPPRLIGVPPLDVPCTPSLR
jgi:hypothetical protein